MRVIVEQLVEWRLAAETEVLGENLPPAPLCPPQIPHDQTQARTQAAVVGSQWLTAWAMVQPQIQFPKRVFKLLEYRTMDKVQKPNNSEYMRITGQIFKNLLLEYLQRIVIPF
jgi:hypothetical protein